MLSAKLNGPQGQLELPFETKIEIKYVSKLGMLRAAPLIVGPSRNHFYALLDEDDVDFMALVDNSESNDRKFHNKLNVSEKEKEFLVYENEVFACESLDRKKFNFNPRSSEEEQSLVSKFATRYDITFEEAAKITRQMKFTVGYSKSVPAFQIFVKDFDGHSLVVTVRSTMSIEKVKELIREKHWIPVGQQRLIFGGRELHDWITLGEYRIKPGFTLHSVRLIDGVDARNSPNFSNFQTELNYLNVRKKKTRQSRKGAICLGKNSTRKFVHGSFDLDKSIRMEPFIVEMRIAPQYSIK